MTWMKKGMVHHPIAGVSKCAANTMMNLAIPETATSMTMRTEMTGAVNTIRPAGTGTTRNRVITRQKINRMVMGGLPIQISISEMAITKACNIHRDHGTPGTILITMITA